MPASILIPCRLEVFTDGNPRIQTINAQRLGDYAMHPTVDALQGWTVTHVDSGLWYWKCRTAYEALLILEYTAERPMLPAKGSVESIRQWMAEHPRECGIVEQNLTKIAPLWTYEPQKNVGIIPIIPPA